MTKQSAFDPALFERVFRQSQEYAKASKRNMPIAKKWFIIAKSDADISKILLNQRYYAGAAYHLQQAFEKLTKGYYIFSGRLEPDEARDHQFVLKRLKREINDEYIRNFLELAKSVDNNEIDMQSSEKSLEVINKSEDNLRMVNKEEISQLIQVINKIESLLVSKEVVDKVENRTKEKRVLSAIKHLIFTITRFRVRSWQVEQAIEREQIEAYLNGAVISIKLHIASILTFLHYNTPRYPNIKNTEINYFDYSKDIGIISMMPQVHELFDNVHKSIMAECKKTTESIQ